MGYGNLNLKPLVYKQLFLVSFVNLQHLVLSLFSSISDPYYAKVYLKIPGRVYNSLEKCELPPKFGRITCILQISRH